MRGFTIVSLIGFIGVAAQLGASLMLLALFLLLRRYSEGRRYFRFWGYAWLAVTVAMIALAIRFFAAPDVPEASPGVQLLLGVYQFAKLMYIVLLVGGTFMYVRTSRRIPHLPYLTAAAVVYAAASTIVGRGLDPIVVWQAPIAIVALSWGAWMLLGLPPLRMSLGSALTGIVMAAIAVLWTVYAVAFGLSTMSGESVTTGFELVVNYNPYLDLLLQVLLGFGMVVVLMEDAKRESDIAHAGLAEAHEQLRNASFHDPLTGALNRRAFGERVGMEAAHAQGGAVVALDLDNLKLVNDSFGHAAGDRLLRRLAEVVRSIVRPYDQLYRWGGDEFLLVLPGARAADVTRRIEEIIDKSNLLRVRESGSEMLRLQVSVGVADFLGAADLEAAVERADNAMLARKAERKKLDSDPAGKPVIRLA